MAKWNKKVVQMVDMSARLDVKVVPATEKEVEEINREFERLYVLIEEKTKKIEEEISQNVLQILSNGIEIERTDKDAKYFLENYNYMLDLASCAYIENKIQKYQDCFQIMKKES